MKSAEANLNFASAYSYLDALNPKQHQAVVYGEGPLLILAGAGTGKTRVLTTRIAHILDKHLCGPLNILSVTFTNKAAQEMRERIQHLLGHGVDGMWLGTFHSISVRILRRYADLLGYTSNFTIIDSDDQLRLIKQILKAENIDDKQVPAKMVASIINRWKDKAKTFDRVGDSQDLHVQLYRQYQERLKILNAMDFGDLLLNCLQLFQQSPEILKSYQQQFCYVLVDEYQDTNIAQYLWLRLLADGHKNLCCVGDDDQSIYGWRGAEVANILKFEKDYNNASIIRLEQNYRSTSHILGTASGLIAHNHDRLGKELWTDKGEGEPVLVKGNWNSETEARFVIDEVEVMQRQGKPLNSMAILVRASYQTRDFEERCIKTGTPYRVIGGLRFYERQEIKDAIAYLRILVQPDDGLAFERIINVPKRGLGPGAMQNIHHIAREQNISLPRAALIYAMDNNKGSGKGNLRTFFEDLQRWRSMLDNTPHADVVKSVLDESGYTGMWLEEKSPDSAGRLENLKEFVKAIEEFEFLPGFLDHVSLVTDNNNQPNNDCLSMMTLHGAKGLEFDYVFLPGWEENLFPHPRSLQDSGSAGLEEERRLAYVGISRAKVKAVISYALQRRTYQGWQVGMPSRFLKELPTRHVKHIPATNQETRQQEYSRRPATIADYKSHHLEIGDRVFHQKFGYGDVIDTDHEQATVEFDMTDAKKIHTSFLKKQ
ncbi:MAG: UvrD-helicase domain-containing protein [Proteobacteria bacterium]|nr:UvrD-helicase domain-containing protein [Pseudomonadota bacterium]